jgi:hypothetical protein
VGEAERRPEVGEREDNKLETAASLGGEGGGGDGGSGSRGRRRLRRFQPTCYSAGW